ncbi:MAG TPA: PRC-barrel domain-containing protein [Stellaceae bacterium]|nr:PRC-barrel domain-containing protein [Stellaceae bacterium]
MRKTMTAAFALLVASSPLALAQTTTSPPVMPSTSAAPSGGAVANEMEPGQIRASKLIGSKVEDSQNNDVGKVSDIVIGHDGRVAAVVLSTGGFAGIGTKYIAVPLAELQQKSGETFALNMSKDQIKQAQEYKFNESANVNTGSSTPPAGEPRPGAGSPSQEK